MSFKPIEQQGEYHQGTRNSISSEQAHNHVMEDLPRSKSHKSRVEEVSERIEGYQEKRKERSVEYGCQKEINSR